MDFQVAQDFAYEIIDGSAIIWRCFSRTTKAVIPSEIEGYPVTSIAPYAFSAHIDEKQLLRKRLTSCKGWITASRQSSTDENVLCLNMSEEQNVLRINDLDADEIRLYQLCGNQLEEIEIPKTVKRVGRYCFYNCKNLNRISFSDALVDWGSGAFTGCHQVQRLEVRMYKSEKTTLKDLLVELPEPVAVDYKCEIDENVYHAKLIFPEYYEEGVENTPARLINLTIHGSGMRFRNCFRQRELQFEEYDKQFRYAGFQEKFEVVATLAEGRLRYPYALKPEYKTAYEDYLVGRRDEYGLLLLQRDDIADLIWFIELLLSKKEWAKLCLDWLNPMIDYAARHQKQEAVSLLMDYHHRLKPASPKKKRSFDFDL